MHFPWIFMVLASANEIRGYIVMSSLIGSAHTRSDPCSHTFQMKIFLFLVNRELSNQIQGYIHFKLNYITISNLLQASYFFIVACHIKPALEPTLPRFWNTIWRHKHSTALYVSYLFAGTIPHSAWWRHQMEAFSALLAICAGNSPVPGEFPAQRPVTRNFDVFFDLRPNKRLSKQPWGWWFETPTGSSWRHYNGLRFI